MDRGTTCEPRKEQKEGGESKECVNVTIKEEKWWSRGIPSQERERERETNGEERKGMGWLDQGAKNEVG